MTKVLHYSAALLLTMALSLLVGGSAAAQHSNNPRYQQFRDTAAASITTPAAGNVRLFFDGTGFYWKNSAGVATALGGADFSALTTGRVPQMGATALENSKMLTSGTNSGTWTLYDDTGGSGVTQLRIRPGAANAATAPNFVIGDTTASANYGFSVYTSGANNITNFYTQGGSAGQWASIYLGATAYRDSTNTRLYLTNDGTNAVVHLNSTGYIGWTNSATNAFNAARDIGLARSAAGILAVTDGSTGQGGIGLSDAATNTVTDALILRHATSDAGFGQDGFGTGLLFQGEDDAGNMQSMASIDAVYTDSANGSEDADLKFYGRVAGADTLLATLTGVGSVASGPQLTVAGGFAISTDSALNLVSTGSSIDLRAAGPLNLYSSSVARWQVNGDLYPLTTNTYDIGTSSARVRAGYFADLDAYDPTVTTGVTDLTLKMGEGQSATNLLSVKNNAGTRTHGMFMYGGGDTYLSFGVDGTPGSVLASGFFTDGGASRLDGSGLTMHSLVPVSTTWIQSTNNKVLTEGAPIGFVDISVASGEGMGGVIQYSVETTDGTDRTVEDGELAFTAINLDGGTVDDADVGLLGTPVQSTSAANTFVNTFTVTAGTNKITINCSPATTLAGTDVITIRYRVVINRGTATVTPL